MAQFSNIQHGLLPSGTVTEQGIIVCSTLTAYEMEDGTFVPFSAVHGPYEAAEPLLVLR